MSKISRLYLTGCLVLASLLQASVGANADEEQTALAARISEMLSYEYDSSPVETTVAGCQLIKKKTIERRVCTPTDSTKVTETVYLDKVRHIRAGQSQGYLVLAFEQEWGFWIFQPEDELVKHTEFAKCDGTTNIDDEFRDGGLAFGIKYTDDQIVSLLDEYRKNYCSGN